MPEFAPQPLSLVNTSTAGDQLPALTASLADGGFVVAWSSVPGQDLYAQRYDGHGAKAGTETLVYDGSAPVRATSVTGLRDGSFVVLWTQVDGATSSVMTQRLGAGGQALGGPAVIASTQDQRVPLVSDSAQALPNGGYLVTYHLAYPHTPLEGGAIHAQQFDAAGARVGGDVAIGGYMGTTTLTTTVLPDGGWVTAWGDFFSYMTGHSVVMKQFSSSGAVVASSKIDPSPTATENLPAAATLADGKYVIAWVSSNGLQAQRFDTAGAPVGAPFTITTAADGITDTGVQVTALADGGFLVSWQHATPVATPGVAWPPSYQFQVLAQYVDAAGQVTGPTLQLASSPKASPFAADALPWSVTATPDGGFVVGTVAQSDLAARDVYQQQFDPVGPPPPSVPTGAVLDGGNGNDDLPGTAGADTLHGGNGKDRLTGLAGDDLLDGGNGVDTAVYLGARNAYTITKTAQGYEVAGPEGNDTLVDVERLQFSDLRVAIDEHGSGGQAYRLYQAAFDRAPDAGGLGFWITSMDDGGLDPVTMARYFMDSQEFATRYGSPDMAQFVDQLYANVLHRGPDDGGKAFWVDHLGRGDVGRAETLVYFAESPENQAALVGVIQDGVASA